MAVRGLGPGVRRITSLAIPAVVSDLAADRKLDKYSSLSSAYTIQPIAIDNLGGFSTSTTSFLSEVDPRLSSVSNDP